MTSLQVDDFSLALTAFFMRMIGLWFTDNRTERWLRRVSIFYTMCGFVYAIYVQLTDVYHVRNNFQNLLFDLCNILSVIVPMSKFLILLSRRKKLFRLIRYMVKNFLDANYDHYEEAVLINSKRKCKFFVCIFVCFTEVTVLSYVGPPLIMNLGKNESERVLPFKVWSNLPLQKTPYFEMTYVAQALTVYIVGRTYFSIDNILCIINLHLAGQFRILQYRLSNKYGQDQNDVAEKSKNFWHLASNAPVVFKSCIRQHQALIAYSEQLQEVFGLIVLVQVLAFSMFICLDGYQMLLVELVQRKVIFCFHFMATVSQLVMFSYSCDCISQESAKLATAAYAGPWLQLPATKNVQNVRKDLIMLIMRSNIPCYITGSGFFIVSLETCTRVLTTAGSYFTLLQQTQDDASS